MGASSATRRVCIATLVAVAAVIAYTGLLRVSADGAEGFVEPLRDEVPSGPRTSARSGPNGEASQEPAAHWSAAIAIADAGGASGRPGASSSSQRLPPSAAPATPSDEEGTRRMKTIADAIATSRRDGDRCVAPIVCQRGVPCVATNANVSLDACDWALPPLDPAIASAARVAMVEVGTNQGPETAKLGLGHREGWYNVAVDPLHREGQILWGEGLATVLVSAAVAPKRGAMKFALGSVMTSVFNAKTAPVAGKQPKAQPAALVPLSEIVAKLVPAAVDARLLLVDAQGFDTEVVLSAGAAQLKRFRYVVIECQELWPEHPKRYSPNSPNCSEAARRLTTEGGLVFLACMRNVALNEFNCVFTQQDHPVVAAEGGLDKARAAIAELQERVKSKDLNPWSRPPYAIQQLQHLVPDAQDAADLSTVMCYMRTSADPINCPVITRFEDLVGTADVRRACKSWAAACNRPRLAGERACDRRAAVRLCQRSFTKYLHHQ